MKDKNGVEIQIGDIILSEGKFKYQVKLVTEESAIESWNSIRKERGPLVLARGINLHHTTILSRLDSTQIEVIK